MNAKRKQRREEADKIARNSLLALKGESEEKREVYGARVRTDVKVVKRNKKKHAKEMWREWYKSTEFIRKML